MGHCFRQPTLVGQQKNESGCATISRRGTPIRSKYRFPHWQLEYEAAIAETDIEELRLKTAALEGALFNRCQSLAGKLGYEIERDAIQLAIDNLRDIQKNKLGFPPWEQYFKKVEGLIESPNRSVRR